MCGDTPGADFLPALRPGAAAPVAARRGRAPPRLVEPRPLTGSAGRTGTSATKDSSATSGLREAGRTISARPGPQGPSAIRPTRLSDARTRRRPDTGDSPGGGPFRI